MLRDNPEKTVLKTDLSLTRLATKGKIDRYKQFTGYISHEKGKDI
jgi:hypothetical protein